MASEKRTVGRKRLLRHAIAVGQGSAVERGCVVRDVSETGAQLIGSQVDTLEGELILSTDHFQAPVRCRVVWRKRHSVGVKFVDMPTLRPVSGPPIRLF